MREDKEKAKRKKETKGFRRTKKSKDRNENTAKRNTAKRSPREHTTAALATVLPTSTHTLHAV